ncbi:uncharacterized protein LOC135496096 [Lineus longissimus]|uniref:uncharacterized protein LOC135496096 n=1 Tax=Lineus longissimus TaxID=88925 RepID=UPI00315C807A
MACSTRAESRLRGKFLCSKCYREFDRSHILWCGQCNCDLFCYTCGGNHVDQSEHEVGDLCDIHDRLLTRYCKTCPRLICDDCESSNHSGQEHDVVEYRDVIAETMKELDNHIYETGETQFTALVDQIANGNKFRKETVTKKRQLCNVIEEVYRTDSSSIDREIMILKEKIVDHQHSIEQLKQDYQARIERLRQDIAEAERRKRKTDSAFQKKKTLIDQIEKDFDLNLRNIDIAFANMKATEEQMRTLLGRASLMAKEKLLAPSILEDIKRRRDDLDELVVAAEKDKITPLQKMVRKAPGRCFTEEYIRAAGLFSSAALSYEIQGGGFVILGVAFMSESLLAVCGANHHLSDGKIYSRWKIMLLDRQSDEQTTILNVASTIFGPKKINDDELVFLCREEPVLRVINVHTGVIRTIDVRLLETVTSCLRQVEVDGSGRFIVLYGQPLNKHLVLISGGGTVREDIEVGDVTAFTLSRLSNMVITCSFRSDVITTYHLEENGFTKIASVHHCVKGLNCRNICSGVLGEIYVVGDIPHEVGKTDASPNTRQKKLYQLELEEDSKVVGLRPISGFTSPSSEFLARCSVFANNIAFCYLNRVKVFTLKP